MFYKLIDKDSDLYKKVYELKNKEKQINEDNSKLIKEKIGLEYEDVLGDFNQQSHTRTDRYFGFGFNDIEKIDTKIWKLHKEYNNIYIPNTRTKIGKNMNRFLQGLDYISGSQMNDLFEGQLEEKENDMGFYTTHYMFVEIIGDEIIIGVNCQLFNKELIEITKVEFDKIIELYNLTIKQGKQ